MRWIRYILLVIPASFLAMFSVSAQQIEQYSQYLFNHLQINPAVAGTKACIDTKIGYRRQWLGFEAQPTTAYVSVQARLPQKRQFLKNRHGIGVLLESDKTGPTSRTYVYAAYAYHISLSDKVYVATGLFAGIQQYHLETSRIRLLDPSDPLMENSGSNLLAPDVSPGVWMYSEKMYAGLSVRQLFRNKIENRGPDTRLTLHYLVTAGYRIDRKNGVSYIPGVLMKIAPLAPPALDLNLLMDIHNQFTWGVGWRNTDALMAMFKVNFLRFFTLGYSFDFTTSKIRFDSANTHEVMLGVYSCSKFSNGYTRCPAYQ